MIENLNEIITYTQNIKLLYVEDSLQARESTLMILEEFFDQIIVAVDGEDGFNKFKENEIDLIITDINMPKLSGLEMTKKIRELHKEIPIYVLSAYNESGFFMESIKIGVEGYLLKPIDMEQFLGVLSKTIEKLKLQAEIESNTNLLHQYQEVTDSSAIVSKTNPSGIITYVNDEFCKISGYSKEELLNKKHNIVRHPSNPKSLYKELWNTIQNKKEIWNGIIKNQDKFGKAYYVNTTIKPILDVNNNILEYIALRHDITDIMNPKKQLIDYINSTQAPFATMFKIENFNQIANFYGQDTVQVIENNLSSILKEKMNNYCDFERIYNLGFGEFVFAKSKKDSLFSFDEIEIKLKKIQKDINLQQLDIGEFKYDVSILVSVAFDEDVLENLWQGISELKKTKQDFIVANNLIKNKRAEAKKNIAILKTIKQAINNSRIVSYFQPIINNRTSQIEKYESLVRLIDNDGKVLAPFFFLDVAKQGKYYNKITTIVLENSFAALKKMDKDISINLSALDIELKSTRDIIFKFLEKNQENSHRVVFELLEDENVKDFQLISQFITDVKKLGVKIAIDDFGVGYSNFERLLNYQPDILKIDGSLIKNIDTNSYSLDIVATIVTFAKKQNITIIAEFVENKKIFDILCKLDIDYSQGYYFGKPEILQ